MKITKYPDGTSYVDYPINEPYASYEREITFKINSYEDLWHLNQWVNAANSVGIMPHVTIPCILDGQADRRFADGQSSGLKLVCEFLNGMNATFSIFHPHNPEIIEALIDDVQIIDNQEFISIVIDKLFIQDNGIDVYVDCRNEKALMSSDAGGYKSVSKLCDKLKWPGELYSAAKSRKWDGAKSVLTQSVDRDDYHGKDILIVDDICVYGGTFIGLSKLLRERNCGKIYLAVSHMTIQKQKSELFDAFDHVFTTNSKYDEYFIPNEHGEPIKPENLTVIKLF